MKRATLKLQTRTVRLYWRPFIVRALHGRMCDVADLVDWPEGEAYQRAAAKVAAAIREVLERQSQTMLEAMRAFSRLGPAADAAAASMRQFQAALPDVCRCGTDANMYQENPRSDNPRWRCSVCGRHVCYDGELDPNWPDGDR